MQEVFLRLWNEPERFDPERGSLRSFLLAQAHGRAVDVLRSDTSRRQREERDARRTAEAGYDIEHEVWDLAVAEQVKGAMAGLPEDERKAIELAYFGGRTYREVAAALGDAGGNGEEPDPDRPAAPAGDAHRRRDRGGMDRLMDHAEIQELLGAYALDAVEPDEAAQIERHLAGCPQCAAEVASYREVAGLLGSAEGLAPPGLWDRIAVGPGGAASCAAPRPISGPACRGGA